MKLARQAEILKLIHQSEIETQEELAAKLNERGFRVTQATVSRDIREMKLTKITGENGKTRYTLLQKKEQDAAGRYVFFVHDYTNRGNGSSTALTHSGAKVTLYRGSQLLQTRTVPASGAGAFWEVFRIEDGEIQTPDAIGNVMPNL